MTENEIGETIILHMQHYVYDLIDKMNASDKEIKTAQSVLNRAVSNHDYIINMLRETVDFLDKYSSDTYDHTWAEELGVDNRLNAHEGNDNE